MRFYCWCEPLEVRKLRYRILLHFGGEKKCFAIPFIEWLGGYSLHSSDNDPWPDERLLQDGVAVVALLEVEAIWRPRQAVVFDRVVDPYWLPGESGLCIDP